MRKNKPGNEILPVERIQQQIDLIRGRKVILDANLARLYEVTTGNLNKAVRRNHERFPEDFMFQLTPEEFDNLRFQSGTSRWGGRRYRPYAFTEHGVAMLSSVLTSERAVQLNILIVRAFIQLRQLLATHKDLARKLLDLERRQKEHADQLAAVYSVVKQLIDPPPTPKRRIGFAPD